MTVVLTSGQAEWTNEWLDGWLDKWLAGWQTASALNKLVNWNSIGCKWQKRLNIWRMLLLMFNTLTCILQWQMNKTNMLYLFCNLFVDKKRKTQYTQKQKKRKDNFDDIDDSDYLALATIVAATLTMTLMSMLICSKADCFQKS